MPKKALASLTETMFYVLMALEHGDMCGTEIAAFVKERTSGRISLGAGTLYTILANFLEMGLIEKKEQKGRKITYAITAPGKERYGEELDRLTMCLKDAGFVISH